MQPIRNHIYVNNQSSPQISTAHRLDYAEFCSKIAELRYDPVKLAGFLASVDEGNLKGNLVDYFKNHIENKSFKDEAAFETFARLIEALDGRVYVLSRYTNVSTRMLTEEGIKIVFEDFARRSDQVNYLGLKTIQELGGLLSNLKPGNAQYELFITHPQSRHVVPIHMRVNDNRITAVVTDSLGDHPWQKEGMYTSRIYDTFSKYIEENSPKTKLDVDIMFFAARRQYSRTACAIHGFHDISKFAKHPELFDAVISQWYDAESQWDGSQEPMPQFNFSTEAAFFASIFDISEPEMLKLTEGVNNFTAMKEKLDNFLTKKLELLDAQIAATADVKEKEDLQITRQETQAKIEKKDRAISKLHHSIRYDQEMGKKIMPTANQQYQKYLSLILATCLERDELSRVKLLEP